MRLFIAINVDPSLKPLLAEIQGKLKPTRSPVSWVRPENLHFTLKFLGEITEAMRVLGALVDRESAWVRCLSRSSVSQFR